MKTNHRKKHCLIWNIISKIFLFVYFLFIAVEAEAITVKFEYPFHNVYKPSDFNDTAIRILEIETGKKPNNYNLHFVLGNLYLKTDSKRAKQEFEKTIRLKPGHYLSYITLGYLMEAEGKQEEAVAYFKTALKYVPNEAVIYNSLASVYMRQNKIDEAMEILEEGLRFNDNDESLYFNQALILMKFYQGQRRQEKIIMNMKRAIAISPKEEYYFVLGVFYLQKQNNNEAKEAFIKARKLNPKNIYAILGLAATYKNTHQYGKAIKIVKEALTIEPDNKDIQEEIKEYEEAYKTWKEKNGD